MGSQATWIEKGQFARLGVNGAAEGSIVWRAYSIASAAHDEHLEFFSVVVPFRFFIAAILGDRSVRPSLMGVKI